MAPNRIRVKLSREEPIGTIILRIKELSSDGSTYSTQIIQ